MPVKNSSCLLLLHRFVFLSSCSTHPPLCFLFENPPKKKSAPLRSVPFLHPGKQEGLLELSCPEGSSLFQLPGWCLQEAVDRWPAALPDAHRALGTACF